MVVKKLKKVQNNNNEKNHTKKESKNKQTNKKMIGKVFIKMSASPLCLSSALQCNLLFFEAVDLKVLKGRMKTF